MNEPVEVVAADKLTVRYGKTLAADAVTFAVPAGSVYALLGRNGAGKSSLVRCLLGSQKPEGGNARLFGRDAWKDRARLMERVGVLPEEPDAPLSMNARTLSRFCGRLYPKWGAAGVEARLSRLGVPLATPFGRLSKGQKGAVMLSLALGHSPDLLILDDPTLGLDVVARREVFEELIGDLADRGTTVFLTTHDLAGVEPIADRVGILKDGRLVLDETMESLKARFRRITYTNDRSSERAAYGNELDEFDAARVKVRGWGIEAVVSNFGDEAFERFRAVPGVEEAEVTGMPLEEIFAAVVGKEKER